MIFRLLAAVFLIPFALAAEMSLNVVRDGLEVPAGGSYFVGTVPAGQFLDTQFRVRNGSSASAWLQSVNVAGGRFSFSSLPKLPLLLAAGQSSDFVVRFQPPEPLTYTAYLNINGTTTVLSGTGGAPLPDPPPVEIPLVPKPIISIDPAALKGAQQAKVAIRFAEASQVAAAGELRIEFKAAVAGQGDDAAILFPATGTRTITFTVAKGESLAKFASRADTEFQTGTVAGTITFTAVVGPHSEQLSAEVPAAPVVFDSARSTRVAAGIEVRLTGYDTSRSASIISFTFFDLEGHIVLPGMIQADASRAFQQYFESTTLGGVFTLRAVFPVEGDSSRIGSMDVELANSRGATRTPKITIQ
jgi:hypothetical protein